MAQPNKPARGQPVSYANAAGASLGNQKKEATTPSKVQESGYKPTTPPKAQQSKAIDPNYWEDPDVLAARNIASRNNSGSSITYDWQDMRNLSLTDRSVPSLRYSPESDQSQDLPQFSSSGKGSPAVGGRQPLTPPSSSSMGLHTPFTSDALSPAIGSGNSNARYQYGGAQSWAPTPSQKRVGDQRTSGYFQSPIDVGRFLLLTGFPSLASSEEICALISSLATTRAIVSCGGTGRDKIIVAYYDPREALRAYEYFRARPVTFKWSVQPVSILCRPISKAEIDDAIPKVGSAKDLTENTEGRIVLEVIEGRSITKDAIRNSLEQIGDVKTVVSGDRLGFIYKAEFFDSRMADRAVTELDGMAAVGGRLKVIYDPDTNPLIDNTLGSSIYRTGALKFDPPISERSRPNNYQNTDIFGPVGSNPSQYSSRASSQAPVPRSSTFQKHQSFPTQPYVGASTYTPPHLAAMGRRLSEPGMLQGLASQADIRTRARLGQGLGGIPRNPSQAIPDENIVFPDRILSGQDMRTSIMIKDVPNKLSRKGLYDILNEVVPRQFDFMYLRFDFTNCCNVGYAFVNFLSVKALYHFIEAKVGKKWNLFSSEKVLQISYANIQGKQNLINKFRNSAVMEVLKEWRPLIFYSAGSQQGLPEPFPMSDNAHINRRSVDARLNQLAAPGTYDQQPSDAYRYEDFGSTERFDAHFGY